MLSTSKALEGIMHRQLGNVDYRNGFAGSGHDSLTIVQSGQLDALVALERTGQAGENAMRFPHLAHRSAAAHKLHSTRLQDK